ncbi:MAG: EipA family protein [Polynucleobacter sp.]|nr:EipA family protein [Polynucleobacter sp.]
MSYLRKVVLGLMLPISMLSFNALAADPPKKPSGTVSINETQFALIIGGSTGGGVLTYEGKKHPFKISGISLGANVGVSKLSAVGEVYDLKELAKFQGTFTKLESSITLGGGVGGTILKNENGVIMRLTSTSEGLQLNLSTSGVTVKFDK